MHTLVIIAVVVGFYMAWNIGANDVANAMSCAVGSKSLTVFWAIALAALCNFLGAVLVGSQVTDTVRSGIVDTSVFAQDPQVLARGMVCALLAAATCLNLASYLGMPVSTTHAIVGGVTGFGLLEAGLAHIHWAKMVQIVSSWFISPIVGGVLAFVLFRFISRYILSAPKPAYAARRGTPILVFLTFTIVILSVIYKGLKNLHLDLTPFAAISLSIIGGLIAAILFALWNRRKGTDADNLPVEEQLIAVERAFILPVIVTSCTVAFAQGANDVANAIGPLAAVGEIAHTNSLPGLVPVNIWYLVLGGSGIAFGLATFGYRVMFVMGKKVTEITPSRGAAANIAGMTTVLACSKMGLPISTTHTLVGAILGVGMARGITAINRKTVRTIFTGWGATIPAAAGTTILFYLVARWLFW